MADSTQTLICPACGKEMQKIFIERTNCYIDICTEGCGGIFFDNREYKKFDENHENIDEIKKALEGKTFKPVDNTIKRVCPVCGMKMMKKNFLICLTILTLKDISFFCPTLLNQTEKKNY